MSTHLPFDIQVQIMERLPIKSLIRFRSLCKSWKSFIDCSEFITGYSFRHARSQHLIIRYQVGDRQKYVSFVDDDTFPNQKFSLTIPSLVQVTTIIGSSHGLLCLTGYFRESDGTRMAVLWNPAIRKSIAVVVPNVVHPPFNYVIGFGVCPHTKDPKLVRISYIFNTGEMESISCIPYQVMVFTLSSREWTTSSCINLPRKSIQFSCSHTVIGQFIYWHALDRIPVGGEYRNLIMSFDMSTQEFREIDLPDSLAEMREAEDLSVSRVRESLAVVEDLWKGVFSVWMMEDGDSKAFTRLFTINAPNTSILSTLIFRKSGEPIIEMKDDNKDFDKLCALVLYEPCSKHIKDLGIHGNKYSFFGSSYMESLLLLDHDDGHIVKCGDVKRLIVILMLCCSKLLQHMQIDSFEHLVSQTDFD